MGWTGEEIQALNKKRRAQSEATAREQQAGQIEEERQRISAEEKAKQLQEKVESHDRRLNPFVGLGVVVLIVVALIAVGIVINRDNQARIEREQQAKAQAAVVAAEQKKVEEAQEKVRETQRAAERKVEEAQCRTDLKCWGNKNSLMAIFKCQDHIEKMAKNQAEWTDGWLEPKFSQFRWEDRARGIITYIGDKIKFQNGFGAWIFHTYQCDFDTEHDTALAVRAQPGRLS